MNDPSMKAEASPAAVSRSSAEANLTFTQALQSEPEPEVNIFVAAMRGDVDLIRELIESGKAKATDKDGSNMCVMLYFADGHRLTGSPA